MSELVGLQLVFECSMCGFTYDSLYVINSIR